MDGIRARQVVEEDNPIYDFSKQVKEELAQSTQNTSRIGAMSDSLFTSKKVKGEHLFNSAKKYAKGGLRIGMFLMLVWILYSWNLKLFNLGDFQKINNIHENCSVINRFDFTAQSWHEELTTSNLENLKAREKSKKKTFGLIHQLLGESSKYSKYLKLTTASAAQPEEAEVEDYHDQDEEDHTDN